MVVQNIATRLGRLRSLIGSLSLSANLPKAQREIRDLQQQMESPEFWTDRKEAERVMVELSSRSKLVETFEQTRSSLLDIEELLNLLEEEMDPEQFDEVLQDLEELETKIEKLETELTLNGEHDSKPAVMTIRSGAGGDDATDFSEMLVRMYMRYAEISGLNAKILEASYADGAGVKSASIKFEAPFAYGKLSAESGTHRLVRMSPFNSARKRQTSFAAVEVVPLIEHLDEVEIPESEIRVDVFRSSGPGGQSVNTTDSAVRITHLPTGTVVSCQNEKSQLQNKIEAMRVLQSRLLEVRRMEEEAQKKQLAGDVKASWGEQMRSYVLAPYRMVKDLRTNYEENNPDDVFSGKLDGFISAGIKWRAQQNR